MRPVPSRLLGVAAAALLVCSLCSAQNLLPNSSFEEGPIGWTLWRGDPATSDGGVVADGPWRGKSCFRVVNHGTNGANLHSDPIPCTPGSAYTLSVYVRAQGGVRLAVAAWGLDAEGKLVSYNIGGDQFVPGDQPTYARISKSFFTPANCTQLKAHLVCNGGTVWWDGVQIEQAFHPGPYFEGPPLGEEARRAVPRNMLLNSGFEAGDFAWTLWQHDAALSTGEVEPTGGHSGKAAFHITNRDPGGANLFSRSVPCEPRTTYTISVWARVKGGNNIQACGWACDGEDKTLAYVIGDAVALPANVPEYRRFTKTFTTPENCTLLRAHLICGGGEVWWDDLQIEKGDAATEYAEGPMPDTPPTAYREAALYSSAMIREARLRDALSQARRLCGYRATHPRIAEARVALTQAQALVASVSAGIGAPYMVPDFRRLDYPRIAADSAAAEASLTAIWRLLGVTPGIDFAPWQPSNAGLDDGKKLTDALIFYPCFTTERYFAKGANWDVFKPFGWRVVSGWWGAWADDNGKPYFEGMDRIIAKCAEHGYKVDIAPSDASGVRWLERKLPPGDIYLKSAKGEWSPNGNCHDTLDIWNPRVREEGAKFLTAYGTHYRNDPRVTSYELVNEPALSIEKMTHGYDSEYLGPGGYGPYAGAEWRRWLTTKYGTVARLNERWRTTYADFASVTPPPDLAAPAPVSSTEAVATGPVRDFQTFRSESHAQHFQLIVAALKRGDPGKPVMSQIYQGFGLRKTAADDLLQMASLPDWDFLGTHDWPGGGPAIDSIFAYSMRRYRWRPHWEEEFIWSQWERKETPEPEMRAAVARNLWRQVAWGKRAVSLFNLEGEWAHDQPNSWNNSMMNLEAEYQVPRYSTGAIPVVERKANLVKDTLFSTRLANQGIAILLPTASVLVAPPENRAQDLGREIAADLMGQHLTPFVVPEECIVDGRENLTPYQVIIAPWAVNVPDELQTKLRAWVEGGGTLISLGPFGLFDPWGKPTQMLLRSALGEVTWQYDAKAGVWRPAPAQDGVVTRRVGRGTVVLIADASGPPEKRLAAVRDLVRQAVPVPPVATALDTVELMLSENAAGERYLFAINLSRKDVRQGDVSVRGRYVGARELTVEGAPLVPTTFVAGVTRVPVDLQPGEGLFFALGKDTSTARLPTPGS